MRQLVVSTFLTLDGVMQAPGGPEEDPQRRVQHGGWTVPHLDEHVGAFMDELMTPPFDLVLGCRTYDISAAYWPHAGEELGSRPAERRHQVRGLTRPTGAHLGEVGSSRGRRG